MDANNINPISASAIFSDETQQFVTPYNPKTGEKVTLCLRTLKDDQCHVFLHIENTNKMNKALDTVYLMMKKKSDALFDYFYCDIIAEAQPIKYFYSIAWDKTILYYNKRGLYENIDTHYHFRLVADLNIPEWSKGAVMYQIFPDRFYNGDHNNDVVPHEYLYLGKTANHCDWNADIVTGDFGNFYGGDIQGIMNKLDYLADLGVEVIYLNPVFVSPSSHKYDIQDYDYVDPHLGIIYDDGGDVLRFERVNNQYATKYVKRTTSKVNLEASNQLMVDFIAKAHDYGIKVILDGVFNHCGCFNKWMDKEGFYQNTGEPEGAYHSKKSPYHDYFIWNEEHWPNNEHYDGWWNNANHPKLNYEDSQKLFDYILSVGKKWVSPPYNADGWRLDVAADLGRSVQMNHNFWSAFYKAVKSANPEAIILAEHYGDPSPWLDGNMWDTVMNYDAFMEPITWFLTGVNKHSDESKLHLKNNAMAFETSMRYQISFMNILARESAMNQLSNHDHSRFYTRTNSMTGRLHTVGARAAETGINKNILMEAVVFQMTWPGSPAVYYGDEAGLCGWTDPDNRRTYPWGKEDPVLIDLHKTLIRIRKKHPVLKTGSTEFLWSNTGFISYVRFNHEHCLIVLINNNNRTMDVVLPVWKAGLSGGVLTSLITTGNDTFSENAHTYQVHMGDVGLTVGANASMILST